MSLIESQHEFFGRWGIIHPVEVKRNSKSNSQYVANRVDFISRTAPGWAKLTTNGTFIGINDQPFESTVETRMFSSPFITITPRLYFLFNATARLWQVLLAVAQIEAVKYNRGEELLQDSHGWRDFGQWVIRIMAIADSNTPLGDLDQHLEAVEVLYEGVPGKLKRATPEVSHYSWTFVLGHEYAHCLLGHLPAPSNSVIASASAKVESLAPGLLNQELKCDALGIYLGCVLPARALKTSAQKLRRLAVGLEGIGVVTLMLQILGPNFQFADTESVTGHPSPEDRLAVVTDILLTEMNRIANWPADRVRMAKNNTIAYRTLADADKIQSFNSATLGFMRDVQSGFPRA